MQKTISEDASFHLSPFFHIMFFVLMYIFIRIDVYLYSTPHLPAVQTQKNDLDISDFRSFYQTMFQIVSLLRSEIMVHGKGKLVVEAADRNP